MTQINDTNRKIDATLLGESLNLSTPVVKVRPCSICANPIAHSYYDHAVFCGSPCAAKAAEYYTSAKKKALINSPTTVAAHRALSFLSGLNFQDHTVKEQREALEVVRGLMTALKPEKAAK